MNKPIKDINLKRYGDGTPSVMRKATVYTELHFYRKSDVLVQLTKVFCERFLPKYGDRTVDQMVQAARLDMRGTQKQIIAQQEQEIAALKARIGSLERELELLRAGKSRDSGESETK